MIKKASILLVLLGICVSGLLFWLYRGASAGSEPQAIAVTTLSESDLRLILTSQMHVDGGSVNSLADSAEHRRAFLDGLREYLALAAEARKESLDKDKDFVINSAYKRHSLLADLYAANSKAVTGQVLALSDDDLASIWNDSANEKAFQRDMEALHRIQTATFRVRGSEYVPTRLQGESLTKARSAWARTKILVDRAKADAEFMRRPEIALRFAVLEAGILSADLLRKHFPDRIKATEAEVAQFLASHPELDLSAKRRRAEDVLRRINDGEDFAKLATQFTEHRPSRQAGGLMEPSRPGDIWPQVEAAALALRPGQVAGQLIESDLGFHIVRLEKITRAGSAGAVGEFTIRHILFQNKFEERGGRDPNVPPPFMTADEIARVQIEKEKRDRFVGEMLERNPISLPEDFNLGS